MLCFWILGGETGGEMAKLGFCDHIGKWSSIHVHRMYDRKQSRIYEHNIQYIYIYVHIYILTYTY